MAFPPNDVQELLAACHRRCCICHRFCGVKIELDHMEPRGDGGPDDIENAIPVCFECHAEIHSYNDRHPRGRKFRADELRSHKQQWLEICSLTPAALINAPREIHVGPLQAMVDELQFNGIAAGLALEGMAFVDGSQRRCAAGFATAQFHRAIEQGALSVLHEALRDAIMRAYALIGQVDSLATAHVNQTVRDAGSGVVEAQIRALLPRLSSQIEDSLSMLVPFLSTDK